MTPRKTALAVAAVAVGVGLWYAFRPERLFINRSVHETFDAAVAPAAASPAGTMVMSASSESGAAMAKAIASGQFHGVAHDTHGTATIYQRADGQRVLRFTDFKTSNGPDVRVYLVAAADAGDNATVTQAGFIEVAPIKGNEGDQNYELPASVDLAKYRTVTIWCRRFSVNFASAPLAEVRS